MRTALVVAATFLASPVLSAQEHGILNEKHPEVDVVFGGQPTAGQVAALAAAGFKTVIDLRGIDEVRGFDEVAATEDADLEYVSIPVTGDTMASGEPFDAFLEAFREAEKPVLVHCASGNRVGALYYAWLVAENGEDRDSALATARESGLRDEALIEPVNAWLDED